MIYKHQQWWLRAGTRGTKFHCVNPLYFFTGCKEIISRESAQGARRSIGLIPHSFSYWPQGNHLKRVRPRGTKDHWVNHLQFFTGCKAIISRDWDQGALRPIGFIPQNLFLVTTNWLHMNWTSIDLSSSDITTYFEIYYYQGILVRYRC